MRARSPRSCHLPQWTRIWAMHWALRGCGLNVVKRDEWEPPSRTCRELPTTDWAHLAWTPGGRLTDAGRLQRGVS